jgi:hypothetical protein
MICYSFSREEGYSMKTYAARFPNFRVVMECKTCHATFGYQPSDWRKVLTLCPNCTEGRRLGEPHSLEFEALDRFREGLKKLTEAIEAVPYEVRIEFDAEEPTNPDLRHG